MSTEYVLHADEFPAGTLTIISCGSEYYIEIDNYIDTGIGEQGGNISTQRIAADEVLKVAARLMYAVRCSWPDKADEMARRLSDDICTTYNSLEK